MKKIKIMKNANIVLEATTEKRIIDDNNVLPQPTKLRKIDERKLNAILDTLPPNIFQRLVQRKLPQPNKIRNVVRRGDTKSLPPIITRIINQLRLLDEPNMDRRALTFLAYCSHTLRYSYNTTQHYFQLAKKHNVFGNHDLGTLTTIVPKRSGYTGMLHIRMVDNECFLKFIKAMHDNFSEYNAPILLAYYTGLRTAEILQCTLYSLFQLKNRNKYIDVFRKQTNAGGEKVHWIPVYNSEFQNFIDNLITLYKESYDNYLKHKINMKLFYIKPSTLLYRVRMEYYHATNRQLPHGFGIHAFRNMMASMLSSYTHNISVIQKYLQHNSPNTTSKYIHVRFDVARNEFNRLTREELSTVAKNLETPSLLSP